MNCPDLIVVIDWKGTLKTVSACTFTLVLGYYVFLPETSRGRPSSLNPVYSDPTSLSLITALLLRVFQIKPRVVCPVRSVFSVLTVWSLFPQKFTRLGFLHPLVFGRNVTSSRRAFFTLQDNILHPHYIILPCFL